MGLVARVAERIAVEIEKVRGLPEGAIAMTEAQMRNSALTQQTTYGQAVALPRESNLGNVPFAPGIPIIPGAINPPNDNGRPDPRRYEFQVAQNINITATRAVPFQTLRASADQIDILRRCIEVLKQKVVGLEWDIVLGEDATDKIIAEIGGDRLRAAEAARLQFNDEISRMRQFWEQPDKSNGLIFADWLNLALEEVLVLDAWAVWPQKSVGGDLIGLQILDGSTIKPLIDDRGMRPQAPNAAFQQILYGFPRSEFAAPVESEEADGEFSSDELAYMVRNRRTTSVYGYSPTERALSVADIYLRRQQWLRAEYTDGVTPELMMSTDANFGNNPNLLLAYENIFNNDLAGQTEQRKRVRLLPTGMTPIQFDGYGERFKSEFDEYLVATICGHYGVLPSEIGFAPKGGLGGAGHQEGQAASSEVIGAIPLSMWLQKMISSLSYVFAGMPRELEFKFMPSNRQDSEALARTKDLEMNKGGLSINEARSISGRSLIDAPQADMPMIIIGGDGFFVTEEGLIPFKEPAPSPTTMINGTIPEPEESSEGGEASEAEETPEDEIAEYDEAVEGARPEQETASKAVSDELRQFIRWVRKAPDRSFEFVKTPKVYAEVLNKFVDIKDYDSARWYAERYLA
jgi:hypothetical protein